MFGRQETRGNVHTRPLLQAGLLDPPERTVDCANRSCDRMGFKPTVNVPPRESMMARFPLPVSLRLPHFGRILARVRPLLIVTMADAGAQNARASPLHTAHHPRPESQGVGGSVGLFHACWWLWLSVVGALVHGLRGQPPLHDPVGPGLRCRQRLLTQAQRAASPKGAT